LNIIGDYGSIFVIKIKGDSMFPTYKNGDVVFVNTSRKEIISSNVYLIKEDNVPQVRRIIKNSYNNTIDIISDNPNKELYPTQHVVLKDYPMLKIHGIVLAGAGECRV
jgi:phage repressor protein C with HTH and peptisase S24 domain